MTTIRFEPLLKVPCEDFGLIGPHFYVQQMRVSGIDYRILYMPLTADSTASRDRFQKELGELPENIFEVKFALGLDFDNPEGYQFATPRELGLPSLSLNGMAALGKGLVDGILMFSEEVDTQGFIALALDEKPKLNQYYARLLKIHKPSLLDSGFTAEKCLGGQGYALFRTSYAIQNSRLASS